MGGGAFRALPPYWRFVMGRFREHQKLRGKYEAPADALREAFMISRRYTPEAELADHLRHLRERFIRLHPREPDGCEVAEISDILNQRGALPLPHDLRAALGKSAPETIRQSDVSKLFRGGGKLRLGSTKLDLSRCVAAPARAPDGAAARSTRADRVVIPGVIFRQLSTAGASCVGAPKGLGCLKRPDGSKVDIICADSRPALSAIVERAKSGTKGYLRMFRRPQPSLLVA